MKTDAQRNGAVVVTGASGGIGFATSRALQERGFRVFGTFLPSEDRAPLDELGIEAIALDMTDPASVEGAREHVARALGSAPLAGLVNNAGIADGGPVELIDLDSLKRMLDVNVFGTFAVTKAFLPALRTARGRVVNISSQSGHLAVPFLAAYCACKFAVEALSDSLRREMLPFGVEVVVVQPAITRTAIWNRAADIDMERFRATPYEAVAVKVQKRMLKAQRKGLDPAVVAAAVVRALTEPHPPTRIPVLRKGKLARYLLSGWLPDRVIDRLVAKQLWQDAKPAGAAAGEARARS
jgi:NAD(P)-dependent dehydrogenase (short-subunit alcohol dehydrogenase family)